MIETIIFDLAEVCVRGSLGFERKLSLKTGIDEETLRECLHRNNMIELFKGMISEDEYWRRVIAELGSSYPVDFFKSQVRKHQTPIPGTAKIVEQLKDNGYTLGLLSDHAREWITYLESKYSFMHLFDERCYSYETGCIKLMPQSFEIALSRLGANPDKTLFIDDSRKNLLSASLAGIRHRHLFINADYLRESLKFYGLIV